jgi:hypothetical protein
MRGLVFILALFCLSSSMFSTEKKTSIILIHGTFARDASWANPGGDFYTELEKNIDSANCELLPFSWNGRLSAKARLEAAGNLSELILKKSETDKIITIGHSHGGNILNLASQILSISLLADQKKIETQTKNLVTSLENVQCYEVSFLQKLIKHPLVTKKRADSLIEKSKLLIPKAENFVEKFKGGHNSKWLLKKAKIILEGTQELITDNEVDKKKQHENLLSYLENLIKKLIKTREFRFFIDPALISKSFLLGCPVDEKHYAPNENIVKKTYNLYSNRDGVQTVFGLYRRTYSEKLKSIKNISLFCKRNRKSLLPAYQPGHRGMHSPYLSHCILKIPNFVSSRGQNSKLTIFYDFSEPLISEVKVLEPGFLQAISQF